MKLNIMLEVNGTDVKVLSTEVVESEVIVGEEEEVSVKERPKFSDYARIFDEGCVGWTKDPEYNKMFLLRQQEYCNDLLKVKGHLFLNRVYELLGIPASKAGQVVGWVYDPTNPNSDNFVDFGIMTEYNADFINGYSRIAMLDFNVDGNILDRI